MNVNYNVKEVHEVSEKVRKEINRNRNNVTDDDVSEIIRETVFNDERFAYGSFEDNRALADAVFNKLRRNLSILQPYADDDSVTEIMVNGIYQIFIEDGSGIYLTHDHFYSTEELEELIRRIAGKVHREFNELNPILDARLPDGSRVNAVYRNVALNGPVLTIRKFPEREISMDTLIEYGTITKEAAEFLRVCVRSGINIFISGGTSSGKTTFLNCLTDFIPEDERLVVIEDSAELKIQGHDNVVRLECRTENVQGNGRVDMTDLIRTSLRMRPSRIIVGEVRGAEVADMINACNTGHDGSLSTGHGNSIDGMMKRLEAMYMQGSDFPVSAIRAQIAEGIDMDVHLSRMPDRSRKVVQIAEICGIEDGEISKNLLFDYDPEKGLCRTENPLINTYKMKIRGESYDRL